MPDHVHMMLAIPPKYAVSQVIGYIKGKSAIPPIGYKPHERSLAIDEPQAERVRDIFKLYLASGSITDLKRTLDQRGWVSPQRMSRRNVTVRPTTPSIFVTMLAP
jgi:REP element-mobilizing transposase RayT